MWMGFFLQREQGIEVVEEVKGGTVGEGEAVDARDVVEAVAQILVAAGLVHELGIAGQVGARRRDRGRWRGTS